MALLLLLELSICQRTAPSLTLCHEPVCAAPPLPRLQAQCWFNEARTRKPQTFATAASEAAAFDTTSGGEHCDFCR